MDWYKFCDDVLHFGGPCMEYAFVGTVEGTWGEMDRGWKFSRLTNFEVSTIVNSNTSNFYLRGEEYKFLKTERDIVTYESPTRAIAFGMGPYYVLIVCSCAHSQTFLVSLPCYSAVHYGLQVIMEMET